MKGKGAKDRYVEMPPCLLTLLRDYYRAYRPKHLLFNGKRVGQPWAKRSAQWSIQNARAASGVEREVSPHVFRYCYATHHLENGTNLVYLKEQLGHLPAGRQASQNDREVYPPMQVVSKTSAPPGCGHGHPLPDRHTIGQLFRDYGEEYIRVYRPDRRTIKLIRSIRVCRTPALGGRRISCKQCGQVRYQYFSCGNSQCPQCQGIKRLQWQDRLAGRMLRVPYCHITFTLPHDLNGLARSYPWPIYNLLLRSARKTVKRLCAAPDNVGGLPGATAVLHTWGSDLKYHVHVHCLVTFGGLERGPSPQWKWPTRKHKLAGFRALCGVFRAVFLAGLKRKMAKGEVIYHRSFEELKADLLKKRWVVNHQRPTADTKVIEEYLGRYICRIGITNKRLHYDRNGQNVRIEYNDYSRQQPGQPAPKAYRDLPPLVAMHKFLQHQLPPYFPRVRHYGLHAGVTYAKIKDQLPAKLKRNGQTVRTVIQILKALLAQEPDKCEHCGGIDFEIERMESDRTYLTRHVLNQGRAPPFGQAETAQAETAGQLTLASS